MLTFQSSSNLASAYGIAVTGAMFIDTCLLAIVMVVLWKWKLWITIPLLAVFFIVDGAYFAANLTKVPDGGWFPLAVGGVAFVILTTWAKGRQIMRKNMAEAAMPIEIFTKSAANSATRVPGTAIFMASSSAGVPSALLHNIKHNKVIHERVVILTVNINDVPTVDADKRCEVKDLGKTGDDGLAREALCMDVAQRGDRDGVFQASHQPGGGARQPDGNLTASPTGL